MYPEDFDLKYSIKINRLKILKWKRKKKLKERFHGLNILVVVFLRGYFHFRNGCEVENDHRELKNFNQNRKSTEIPG